MRFVLTRALVIAVGASLLAGCARHRAPSPADRFLLHKEARRTTGKTREQEAPPSRAAEQTLAEGAAADGRGAAEAEGAGVDAGNDGPVLAAALKAMTIPPTADGLFDGRRRLPPARAHRSGLLVLLTVAAGRSAARADTRCARARLARLGPATARTGQRASRHLLRADVGVGAEHARDVAARRSVSATMPAARIETAILLDPKAGYAFNNLCYLSFVEGKSDQAISECRAALTIDPQSHRGAQQPGVDLRGDRPRRSRAQRIRCGRRRPPCRLQHGHRLSRPDTVCGCRRGIRPGAAIAHAEVVDAERRARDARRMAEVALTR